MLPAPREISLVWIYWSFMSWMLTPGASSLICTRFLFPCLLGFFTSCLCVFLLIRDRCSLHCVINIVPRVVACFSNADRCVQTTPWFFYWELDFMKIVPKFLLVLSLFPPSLVRGGSPPYLRCKASRLDETRASSLHLSINILHLKLCPHSHTWEWELIQVNMEGWSRDFIQFMALLLVFTPWPLLSEQCSRFCFNRLKNSNYPINFCLFG